jgi:hypothetical protein
MISAKIVKPNSGGFITNISGVNVETLLNNATSACTTLSEGVNDEALEKVASGNTFGSLFKRALAEKPLDELNAAPVLMVMPSDGSSAEALANAAPLRRVTPIVGASVETDANVAATWNRKPPLAVMPLAEANSTVGGKFASSMMGMMIGID